MTRKKLPPCQVLPFPRRLNFPLVDKVATKLVALDHEAAEAYLRNQLLIRRNALASRGVATSLVEDEVASFEAAIRGRLFTLVLIGGVAR